MKPHEPGALHPSAELLDLLALCEALGERIARSPSLDVAAVRAVEEELGARLPDDALVIMATGSGILRCATNLVLDSVLDASDEEWSDGVPDDHVAIAYVYSEPFAERDQGAHGGPYEVLAIDRATSTKLVVVSDGMVAEGASSIAAFARDKIEAWYRNRPNPVALERFEPRLVGELRSASNERWATHPKLGRGRVLEVRDDKCVFELASGKKMTLLRSVLAFDETAKPEAPAAPRPSESKAHEKWPAFAARLREKGVDPDRGFFEQADASKGLEALGYQYRQRDADARVRVTLGVLRELWGVKLPWSSSYEQSESESWSSPEHCFARAFGLKHEVVTS